MIYTLTKSEYYDNKTTWKYNNTGEMITTAEAIRRNKENGETETID